MDRQHLDCRGVLCGAYHDNSQFTLREICKLDLLDRNSLPSPPIESSIYRPERSLPKAIPQLLYDISSKL
jgi:hypothetical protein